MKLNELNVFIKLREDNKIEIEYLDSFEKEVDFSEFKNE